MKRFIKIGVFVLALALLLPLSGCNGCTKFSGNYPHYFFCESELKEGGIKMSYYEAFEVSTTDFTYAEADETVTPSQSYLYGGTAPRYEIEAPEGYEGVIPRIESYELDENSVVDACGYVAEGKLYGYINVFYKTIGYFAGGGNYGVEEICKSVIFEYAPNSSFKEIASLDGVLTVGLCGNDLLYWKDRKYYAYNLTTQTETFLVDDLAYDSGLQHQSRTKIYTTTSAPYYTLLLMVKARGASETEYCYLYDYSSRELAKLNKKG